VQGPFPDQTLAFLAPCPAGIMASAGEFGGAAYKLRHFCPVIRPSAPPIKTQTHYPDAPFGSARLLWRDGMWLSGDLESRGAVPVPVEIKDAASGSHITL
jgi:hypothetical protein